MSEQEREEPAEEREEEKAVRTDGPLLTLPERQAAKMGARLWTALDDAMAVRTPRWERNRLARKGVRGVRIVGTESARDDSDGVWVPPGAADLPPVPNNVDQLVRRIVDTITADEPKVEAVAPSSDDLDKAAAELATRILENDDNGETGNLRAVVQRALNRAGTYCSAFSFQYVDPYGVREPLQLLAHPEATDPDAPLVGPDGRPPADGTYVERFVVVKGGQRTLSPSPAGAEMVWKPVVKEELRLPHCVRLLPATAESITEAEAVFVGRVTTLGALKAAYPKTVGQMDAAAQRKLCAWRPSVGRRYWVPLHLAESMEAAAKAMEQPGEGPPPAPSDETPVFVRQLYWKAGRAYARGLTLLLGHDEQLLDRGVWSAEVGEGEQARDEAFDLPVAQLKFFDDPMDADPYGISPVEWLAPMDDAVATQIIAWMEYLYRFNHPNVFLGLNSPIQPSQLAIRDGTPIRYDVATGKPEYEQIPAFPGEAPALIERFEGWMRTLSGLENAARGVADPSVKSGVHAERIIEQALVALTQVVSNVTDFLRRRARVRLQLTAAHFTAPRLLRLGGAGSLAQVKAFQGADLRGVRDVRLRKNSMTMLTRSAKVAMLREELEIGIKSGDPAAYLRYRAGVASLVDSIATEDDDPHAQRVERQLVQWQLGPEGGTPADAIWAALPVDTDPTVAPMRAYRLGRAIASDRFTKFDPAWNTPLVAAYEQARQAAGLKNAQEQAEAQAQNAQGAQQAEQAKAQGELQKAQVTHQQELEKIQMQSQVDTQSKLAVAEAQAATRAGLPASFPLDQ